MGSTQGDPIQRRQIVFSFPASSGNSMLFDNHDWRPRAYDAHGPRTLELYHERGVGLKSTASGRTDRIRRIKGPSYTPQSP
jgi:hypothetical protein